MYIYYRVRTGNADLLHARVSAMQASLSAEQGIATALKRRPEDRDGWHTWMEVYAAIPDGFDKLLERALERADVANLIDGERHIEYFQDMAPCA